MQLFKHGVILGILLIFGLLSEQAMSKYVDPYYIAQIGESEQRGLLENVSLNCKPLLDSSMIATDTHA